MRLWYGIPTCSEIPLKYPIESSSKQIVIGLVNFAAKGFFRALLKSYSVLMVTLSSVLLGFMACGFSGRNDSDHVTVLSIATANQHNLKRAT